MNDTPIYVGAFGTLASVSLGTFNDILGIACGVLTAIYLLIKINQLRNGDK